MSAGPGELEYRGAYGLVRRETVEEPAARKTRNDRDKKIFLIHIRDNETGEVRIYREVLEDPGAPWNQKGESGDWFGKDGWYDGPEFMWTEGNYSCDCNRYLYFQRAAGIEPFDDPDFKIACTDEANRYDVVNVFEFVDGQLEDILCGDVI